MKVLPEFQVSRFIGLGWALMSQSSLTQSGLCLLYIRTSIYPRLRTRISYAFSAPYLCGNWSYMLNFEPFSQSNLRFSVLGVKFSETLNLLSKSSKSTPHCRRGIF